ncbi:MAG TPA: helix-turn-helix domain-containing protein [Casimicrobiaceae bacterium]
MPPVPRRRSIAGLWKLARFGDYRSAAAAAHDALRAYGPEGSIRRRVDLSLIAAFCAMRQGHYPAALHELEIAGRTAASLPADARLGARVDAWRAELAYFQGRYSDATGIIDRLLPRLEQSGERAYVAFALRIRIAILLARTEYDEAIALGDRAIGVAEASGDDYVIVQILNVLGAVYFDRATSKLSEPHARAHLSSLDPRDAAPMEADAREALRLFQRARTVAERAHYEFAAWYVAGNIERLEIVLGHADRAIGPIRRRLRALQRRGATYDEIVARSNLAWGLRTLGHYREALQELDVGLKLAQATGTSNVLLEFLEYDRSIVLDALGDGAGARASYRRYLQLVGAFNREARDLPYAGQAPSPKRPLEPFFLKRADRFILEHLDASFTIADLAKHCGVSWRTLETAFRTYRGIAPVAHIRNVRLDRAHRALAEEQGTVGEIAVRHGFRSSTTFTLEFRKRFGTAPSKVRRLAAS